MKRSKKAALVLMVPATTFLFAGCAEEPEQGMVFGAPSECYEGGFSSPEACEADYQAAQALHPQVAPKYLSKAECEADFGSGQCETAPQQTSAGGSVFMPMMMGYMMGSMLNRAQAGGSNFQQSGTATRSNIPTQPLYKSRDDRNTFRTASNQPIARSSGLVSLKPSQVKPQSGQLVRRGGFGQQAAMRTSFGG
jgi:uncharacterized protein YgiB involved in biofilm formation